jgi:hypothetical protein
VAFTGDNRLVDRQRSRQAGFGQHLVKQVEHELGRLLTNL